MSKILVFCAGYTPSVKYGGPVRSIANLIELTGDIVSYRVIAADRDVGDTVPYPNIKSRQWQSVGKAQVYYIQPEELNLICLRRIVRSVEYDVLFLNSQFSPAFTILPLLLRRVRGIKRTPTVLATRGECAPEALQLKAGKKRLYLFLARLVRLYSGVSFLATADHEERDIRRCWGLSPRTQVFRAPEIPERPEPGEVAPKSIGSLRLIFLGRISPIKNLSWGLEVLSQWADEKSGKAELNIYGPIEDATYWNECNRIIAKMPESVCVRYNGLLSAHDKFTVLRQHHCLFSPSKGENFGHAIAEALLAGVPVLTTEKTPWRDLRERGAGWSLPISEREFKSALSELLSMDQATFSALSNNALNYSRARFDNEKLCERVAFLKGLVTSTLL